jgi:phenylacetate-CoA ligase
MIPHDSFRRNWMYNSILKRFIMPLMQVKSHTNSLKCLRSLEKSQWSPRKEIELIQLANLRALLRHAYDTVPFYNKRFKQFGLRPESIKTVEQLAKLPKLTKQQIKSNANDMISSTIPKSELTPFATGGSTGEPLLFFKDKRTTSWAVAATSRSYRWAGLDLGDKYIILWSSPFDLSTSKKISGILDGKLMRYKLLQSSNMSEESMGRIAEMIRKIKPRTIKGYASSLTLFANYLKTREISDLHVHSVISTAENLPPSTRILLEERFNCEVFDTYGSREVALMAGECQEHSGLHVSTETVLLEFVSGDEPAASGELGEILVTDLQNYGMPLIRYAIGDAGRPTDEVCSCGRGLPLTKSIDGRVTDFIRASDGRSVPGPAFIYFFADLPVKKYQVVQYDSDYLTVKVIPDVGYSPSDDQRIVSRIKGIVGNAVNITVEHVNDIPSSSRSGKFLPVISKIHAFDSSS